MNASLAMADIHPGYGFPIGGVGAFDIETGVISVAGVGFDINCGVRVLKTPLTRADVEPVKEALANQLFRDVPSGVGSTGEIRLKENEIDELLVKGSKYIIDRGYGFAEDLEYTEENGAVADALPENVSSRAKERQFKQVGTLGSGNHYLEVQYVEEIFDNEAASAYGLEKDQVLMAIHCGSRALGHQIGTDYLKTLEAASKKVRHPHKRPGARLRSHKKPRGAKVFYGRKLRHKLRLREQAGHLAPRKDGVFPRDRNETRNNKTPLRRRAQYLQDRDSHDKRRNEKTPRPP